MLGSILGGLFGSDDVNQNFYNPLVNTNLNWLGGQFQSDAGDVTAALNAFKGENAQRIADTNRLRGQAESDYNTLFASNMGYNPMADYERLRSGNLGALKEWSGVIGDVGSRNDTMARAAMGLGGRPGGSYERVLTADRVSRNLSPVVGQVLGNLGRDASALGALRSGNLSDSANLINARTNTANIGAGLSLAPAYALMDMRGMQTDLLGNQAAVARANTSGYTKENNWADKLAAGDQAGMNSLSQAADIFGKVVGGVTGMGGVGSALGGMSGGGGGMGGMFSGGSAGFNPYSFMGYGSTGAGGALQALGRSNGSNYGPGF